MEAFWPHKTASVSFQLRAIQIQSDIIRLGRGEFRFGLRHIYRAVRAALMERLNQREILLSQVDGLPHYVPVEID